MKGVKGKVLKKLQSIKPIGYLKQDRILHVNAADGYVENFIRNAIFKSREEPKRNMADERKDVPIQEQDIIDVAELMKDLEDEEMDAIEYDTVEKENVSPLINARCLKERSEATAEAELEMSPKRSLEAPRYPDKTPLSEIDISSFRRPDLNSSTLFDPNLLAAFELAVKEHVRIIEAERRPRRVEAENLEFNPDEPPSKSRRIEEIQENENAVDPLLAFEEKSPPGGSSSVIFYTTSLRGIRKTFENCSQVRFLLESFKILYVERDVSMHSEFKEELWAILGNKAIPPRLFVKGRYIGGAEEVVRLHEQGRLKPLLEGVQPNLSQGPCEGCGGIRFVLCFKCNGSHRIVAHDAESGLRSVNCSQCNENGLIVCPLCC
ncbi:uncharacterized protein At3g28850-like [Punica granatum]|uniref:Glutaredoxin domain-containing protein n=2 Tax=Punica granatum TaxID=22663 RepID=A0A218VS04_PUNGR|nr:uncharacterized protein At3g28850-like [Punica granatum]OWM63089.1 hypothetical protein CDL15_Pgr008005 [Punica granatum]PKI43171.1 hypothetical protein CRG98_036429 [Punica granatum]